ncbi:MAG: AI-2E family transporter, partial [Tannerellaceae bacterium]|nr:AI-2E family transporter [Tannerellaceae bacterium]
ISDGGGISGFGINIAILVLVLYFMLIGVREMEKYVYSILPFNDENKKQVMGEINIMVKSNAIGIPLLAIIQGVIATIGYFIFKAPTPILFGLIACVATIIPVIGTAIVWFPLCLYMGISGHWLHALGLGIYAIIVISNADNFIRFMLQKKLADIHPLITIFGVFIGLSLFGFIGVIFGPLLISFFLLCFNIFKRELIAGKEFRGVDLEGMNRDKDS